MRAVNKTLFSVFVILILSVVIAQAYDEADFFSYKRFQLNEEVLYNIENRGATAASIIRFAQDFQKGVNALDDGRTEQAKVFFLKAREEWPEYFATDFLLALTSERAGDYGTAARYYKSYLIKLKGLEEDKYRISSPVIRSLSMYPIEEYASANAFVNDRVRKLGLDFDRVRPSYTLPFFVVPTLAVILIVTAYIGLRYHAIPYIKKQDRINNPPEGFWVCRHCGEDNTELEMVCRECNRARE